jgi:hypothetical protein
MQATHRSSLFIHHQNDGASDDVSIGCERIKSNQPIAKLLHRRARAEVSTVPGRCNIDEFLAEHRTTSNSESQALVNGQYVSRQSIQFDTNSIQFDRRSIERHLDAQKNAARARLHVAGLQFVSAAHVHRRLFDSQSNVAHSRKRGAVRTGLSHRRAKHQFAQRELHLGADTGLHRCRRLNSVDSAG